MLTAIQIIAERRITEAIREGRLETKSWHGKPLPRDDDHLVPQELRMAYKLLKNAGYLPPEIETKKEIQKLEELIAATEDEHVRVKQMKKLNLLLMKLGTLRKRPIQIDDRDDYFRKVIEKISINPK